MNGTIVARVRRVLAGHSERTLVHAVDDNGMEYKIEVSSEALRDLRPGQEHVLMLSWTLQPVVSNKPAAAAAPAPLSSAVDDEFMALMARPRGASGISQTSATSSTSPQQSRTVASTVDQLAQRLGIHSPSRTPS